MQATLERVDLPADDQESIAEQEIMAASLQEQFGYTALTKSVAVQRRLSQLRAIGIRPFSESSVTAYKRKAVRAANRTLYATIISLIAVVVLATILTWISGATVVNTISVSAFVCAVCMAVFCYLMDGTIPRYRWDSRRLEYHMANIPRYVLETALAVKEAVPSATLCVHELHHDPFLVLLIDGTEYYIEVWDEPKFGAKRTV